MSGNILVVGATGNVGAPLVEELVKRGVAVKAGSRNKPANLPEGAEWAKVDLADSASVEAALDGVDAVYLLAPGGTVDPYAVLKPAIEAAAKHGVKVVLQTAIGVEADDNIPFRQAELLLERSGAPYVILRPNWFSDNLANYWSAGVADGAIRLPAGDGRSSLVDTRDIAAAAAGALTSDAHNGKAFVLTGSKAYSYFDVADLLTTTGRKVTYTPVGSETFVKETMSFGVPADYAELLAAIFVPVANGWTADVTSDVETLSGKAPRSFEDSVGDIAARIGKLAA